MSLPLNQEFHRDSRAIAEQRVRNGLKFDARQPRLQRDPSYKGVPPNSTGSWTTAFTLNHDQSWKPLVPLKQQDMDLWRQEQNYRSMLAAQEITGGFARSPEAQKWINERLRKKGVQASKQLNPFMTGNVIKAALTPSEFGKFQLSQNIERMDDILDSSDKMTLVLDNRALIGLIESVRASMLSLSPTFTVSEAQNVSESLTSILKKAEALLGTAMGKDIQHIRETDDAYDPKLLQQNTRALASIVNQLKKLTVFAEQIWSAASTTDEKERSTRTIAAAREIFSRVELSSGLKEAGVQLQKWNRQAAEDAERERQEQEQEARYADALQQQVAQEQQLDIPAFEARATAAAAREAEYVEEAPVNEEAPGDETVEDENVIGFPFTEDELRIMNPEQFADLIRLTLTQGQLKARQRAGVELALPVAIPEQEEMVLRFRRVKQPQSVAGRQRVDDLVQRALEWAYGKPAKALPAAAPAAAAAAPEIPAGLSRDDKIKYAVYVLKMTQVDTARSLGVSQATVSRVAPARNKEIRDAFLASLG